MTAWVYLDQDGRVTGGMDYPPDRAVTVPEGAVEVPSLTAMVGMRWTGEAWTYDPLPDLAPEDPAAARLDAAQTEARNALIAWLDAQARDVTGRVPEAEKMTYDAKEAAAQRIQAGIATQADTSLIGIEAALAGEDSAVTVDKILTNAARFRVAGPLISGIRRRGSVSIKSATTPEEAQAALNDAQALYLAALADPQAFAADPVAWLAAH